MEAIFSLILFVFVASITPGPNNLMLLSAGANFGFRKSMPHLFGINMGSGVMVWLVGVGLMELFDKVPLLLGVLKVACLSYLLFLAWRLVSSKPSENTQSGALQPLSFWEAAAFQWINPKAWAMVLTAVTVYALGETSLLIALTAVAFCSVNLPCITLWLTTGVKLRRWLEVGSRQYWFNCLMAMLLVVSALPMLFM